GWGAGGGQAAGGGVGVPAACRGGGLAWLAPEPVPDFLIGVPVPAIAEDLDEALADLAAYSLVQRNPDRQEFSVHRLVQDVTRRSLGGAGAHTALTQALGGLGDAFTGDAGGPRERTEKERLAHPVRARRGDREGAER